jgi:small subunit ribosomal protein S9
MDTIHSIGRRKSSTARVYFTKGSGKIVVNGKEFKDYFPMDSIQGIIMDPIRISGAEGAYDIKVNVAGGGFKGQAEAIRMAFARTLVKISEDNKKPLKEKKYLTRDSRVVERKKFGKPKARKSFQFSKR